MSTGLFVCGMHRSGTSAAAQLVSLLGVPLGPPNDLMREPTDDSPKGHWESRRLLEVNEELLLRLGGSWSGPPKLPSDWHLDPALDDIRSRARTALDETFATDTWAWKDPRNSLTLPFWTSLREVRAVGMLVWRNPLEVAASLGVRNAFSVRYSLALWERYTRAALVNLAGLPVLVSGFPSIVGDPDAWSRTVAAFLNAQGIAAVAPDQSGDAVDPSLRHSVRTLDDLRAHPDATPSQIGLAEIVESLDGAHASLEPTGLPDESPFTATLLDEHRRWYLEARAGLDKQREIFEDDLHAGAAAQAEAVRALTQQIAQERSAAADLGVRLADLVDRLRSEQATLQRRSVRTALSFAKAIAPLYRLINRFRG